MAKSDLFKSLSKEGYVTAPLDMYLLEKANRPNDRAINVNAPSCAGKCMRANYYSRMGYESDGSVDPRSQRIFDNGDGVHERLQGYLLDMGLLICDELPLINDELSIQGHTDGILDIDEDEIAILELKSINDAGFQKLKDAKDEHKRQGFVYLYCAEERRLYLRKTYKTREAFRKSQPEREKYFREHYQHMKSGKKWTREEKIENEVKMNIIADDIFYDTPKPITKVIFVYENKNDQTLKEYVLERDITTEELLQEVLEEYRELNEYVKKKKLPPRCGSCKSCQECRWCNYKLECWR